jgi:hypothetical protein
MALNETTIMLISLSLLGILVLVLLGCVIRLNAKLKRFLIGTGSQNIEESLKHISSELKVITQFRKDMALYLKDVEGRVSKSIQGVHTVRFNPFKGTGSGGNQSFATALIDEDGNGVIISSLYSRERVSVFSKPIKDLSSEFELTAEEKEALQGAKASLAQRGESK